MVYLFSHFFWIIFPIMGMGIGYFSIWKKHQQHQRALDLLKTYADKGVEPPAAVLEALRGSLSDYRNESRDYNGGRRSPWPRAVFFGVMALGFACLAFFGHGETIPDDLLSQSTVWVFFVPVFVFAAIALSAVVQAVLSRGRNDQ